MLDGIPSTVIEMYDIMICELCRRYAEPQGLSEDKLGKGGLELKGWSELYNGTYYRM